MSTFRNDRQRAKACRLLLQFQHLERFWHDDDLGPRSGPTEEACTELSYGKQGIGRLSTSEHIMLRVAFDFWNGGGGASIWDIQSHLDVNVIHAIGELLITSNENPQFEGRPVDDWLEKWRHFRVYVAPHGFTVG